MSVKDLREALAGPRGSLDGYLEIATEAEVRADILALTGTDERRKFAAMAMQGLFASGANEPHKDYAWMANRAVTAADMLLAELAKAKP